MSDQNRKYIADLFGSKSLLQRCPLCLPLVPLFKIWIQMRLRGWSRKYGKVEIKVTSDSHHLLFPDDHAAIVHSGQTLIILEET